MTENWTAAGVVAVIPARGGSKGVHRKNLRQVAGLSLIGWAAQTCGELPWLGGALLSTDDEEMAAEGRRHGLAVPGLRPAEFATDAAGSLEMWQQAWGAAEEHFGRRFECSVLLQPTTPLRYARDVERCVAQVLDEGHEAAVTVGRVPGHFVPEKLLRLDGEGCVETYLDGARTAPRQSYGEYYWRDGACYAVRRRTLMEEGLIIERDCKAVVADEPMINIDDPVELEYCEALAARRARLESESDPGP